MSDYKNYINDTYRGGYRYPVGARRMKIDEEASKEAAYQELEEMANEMLKFMDANGIDIFELEIKAPQRKKSWKLTAEEKVISGRYKWEDPISQQSKEGNDE